MSESKTQRLDFPRGFLWSAATSAHQIEGGNVHSDWWDFEARPGVIKRGEKSGQACDHWNRVAEDVALAKSLNLNHYRFSVEWARIEPVRGVYDEAALAHYERELELLHEAGIQPLVTLHHFTLPLWLAKDGGWAAPHAPELFAAYCARVYERLGALARDFLTLNEPMVIIVAGYVSADFPPGLRDPRSIQAPLSGLVNGHVRAYHALHDLAKKAQRPLRVGLAHHLRVFDPARRWLPADWMLAHYLDKAFNWAIPDALRTGTLTVDLPFAMSFREEIPNAAGTEDFIGLNYYSRDIVRFAPLHPLRCLRSTPPGAPLSDLGWEIYPEGLYRLLKAIQKRYPQLPVMITENGLADARDTQRAGFIRAHLAAVHQALADGVAVEGYSHWSLLDNFEWAEGFEPRFGLCEVDYRTFTRTARGSAHVYADIARTNSVVLGK